MVLQTVCPLAVLEGYGFKTKVMVKSDCCGKERDKTGDNSGYLFKSNLGHGMSLKTM